MDNQIISDGEETPNDQIVIAFSGRKNAGKNTVASFVSKYFVNKLEWAKVEYERLSFKELQNKMVLECSFADNLKEFCIDTLGLTYEQCYGSDAEKNSPTEYDWENAPDFLRWKFGDEMAKKLVSEGKSQDELETEFFDASNYEMNYATGKITGREVMQIFGTDLCRQTFGNIWAEATIRRIKGKRKRLNLITDNRFPNEIKEVLKQNHGYVIRLTRSPFGTKDSHPSESSLDDYDWSHEKCFVLDNEKMTIEEQNEAVKPFVDKIFEKGAING